MNHSHSNGLRLLIPTVLTLANAIAGLGAVVAIHRYDPANPSTWNMIHFGLGLVLVGMVFDALDGLVARLMRSASEFGAELDSLCDGVTFGLVPAYMLWAVYGQGQDHLVSWFWDFVITLYLACVLLRLARFNLQRSIQDKSSGKRFVGLPSPAGAGCILSIILLQSRADYGPHVSGSLWLVNPLVSLMPFFAPIAALLISFLMVSTIPFPHPGRQLFGSKTKGKGAVLSLGTFGLALLMVMAMLAHSLDLMVVAGFGWFVLHGVGRHLLSRKGKPVLSTAVSPKITH